jgi:hypothetical protein
MQIYDMIFKLPNLFFVVRTGFEPVRQAQLLGMVFINVGSLPITVVHLPMRSTDYFEDEKSSVLSDLLYAILLNSQLLSQGNNTIKTSLLLKSL